jgi:predicted lipid-binding transport protein (Tim44 family)
MRSLLISAVAMAAGVVLAVAVAACGSSKTKTTGVTATAVTTGTTAPTTDETVPPEPPAKKRAEDEIEKLTTRYLDALGSQDFKELCGLLAPESITRFHRAAKKQGLDAPSCPAAYKRVYRDPDVRSEIETLTDTADITRISVDGDTAVIFIKARFRGKATSLTKSATRIDGRWKFVDVS